VRLGIFGSGFGGLTIHEAIRERLPRCDRVYLGDNTRAPYELLLPVIHEVVPAGVRVLSQGEIVAPSLESYLRRHPQIEGRLSRGSTTEFLTTDVGESFDRLARLFLGHVVASGPARLDP
jgi:glutamate racemase